VLGVFNEYSGGIPKPHQLGGTDPDITDANRSIVSLIDSSDVDGLDGIGVDCALETPSMLGGVVVSVPAAAIAADGAVTTGDPG
jgi:hypothetical protein